MTKTRLNYLHISEKSSKFAGSLGAQILVPDNTLVSRIISCENQVTESECVARLFEMYQALTK